MFLCDFCSKTCGPRISPRIVSLEREMRHVNYMGWDEDGRAAIVGSGVEVTAEYKQCPDCSGIPVKIPPTPVYHGYIGLATGMWGHAMKCRHMLTECTRCATNIETFSTFPLPALTVSLTERSKSARLTTSLVSVVVDKMIDRSTHNTKRGQADFGAAYGVLKPYEARGGGL